MSVRNAADPVPDFVEQLERLSRETYALEHSPNCRNRYLIRLVGRGKGTLDLKPYNRGETEDILGFGRKLKKAVDAAFSARMLQGVQFKRRNHSK